MLTSAGTATPTKLRLRLNFVGAHAASVTTTMNELILAPEFTKEMEPAIVSCVYVGVGDYVEPDSVLLDIETEKVALGVCAPVGGTIIELNFNPGESVASEQILLSIAPGPAPVASRSSDEREPRRAQGAGAGNNSRSYMQVVLIIFTVLALGAIGVFQWL